MADVGGARAAMETPTGGGSDAGHATQDGSASVSHAADDPGEAQREGDEDEALEDFGVSSDEEEGEEAQLDKAMMNELLLVCSNLGMLRVQNEGEAPVFMRGEDCEEWIHDLQRAIRRDDAKNKLVAKQLGRWKILQKKLLRLLVNHQHDWSLVFSILKVLVMLTMKPTRDSTNISQQFKYLRQYKHEFLRNDIIPIMMSILVEPLSRKGSARTEQDYLNMEIVLTLLRNLLAIPNADPRFVTSTTSYLSHLQEDLICTLHEENVYEMLLLFAQDIDSPENREWNLLVMEMLDLTLDCSQPKSVVAYSKKFLTSKETKAPTEQLTPSQSTRSAAGSTPNHAPASRGGGLLEKLNKEKMASSLHQSGSRRHSNFGGIMTMVGPTGRTTVLSDFSKTVYDQVPQAPKKPASRRRGKRSAAPITDINEVFGGKGRVTESDERTMRVLQEICDSIISKSYFQLTNSLKAEFRRGSSKLVSTDRLQYFHLVWFLTTYHRLKLQALKSHYRRQVKAVERKRKELQNALDFTTPPPPLPEKPIYDEKAVLSTLDMFSFNFVLQSIENYATLKNYHGMTVSVQLLAEMMAYLAELTASDDPRFQRIADSLQHKIFYERDFLDRLPVLLKTWTPGQFSTAYVTDVVTLTHLVFKVLDAQGTIKVLSRRKAYLDKKRLKKKNKSTDGESKGEDSDDGSTDEEETERQAQLLMEMQRKEADFDVRKYFSSIVSSDTVKMYCHLLANYRENSAKVNHYIHSFFYRTKHFKIQEHEEWTMQPILFNIHVLVLFNKMLQDAYIQRLPEYKNFLDFIRGVVRDFFALAEKNNVLFVECLLRQPYASKACLLMQRNYEPIDSISRSRAEAVALGREKRIEAINEVRRQKIAMDHEELEGEAEFEFTLGPSDFQASSLVENEKMDGASSQDKEREAELNMDVNTLTAAPTSAQKPKKTRAPRTRAAKERAKNWSKVEDRYLAKVFMKYRHLPSVYEVISYEDMFQDRDRTAEQIERRVKYLKLHRKTYDSSDEEEAEKSNSDIGDDDDLGLTRGSRLDTDLAALDSSRPRRRLRRGEDLSDSDSDDDLLLSGAPVVEPSQSVAEPSQSTTAQMSNGRTEDASANGDNLELAEDVQAVEATQDQEMVDEDESSGLSKEQSSAVAEDGTTTEGQSHEMEDTPMAGAEPVLLHEELVMPSVTQAVERNQVVDTPNNSTTDTAGPEGEGDADKDILTQDHGADDATTDVATVEEPVEPVATTEPIPMDTDGARSDDPAPITQTGVAELDLTEGHSSPVAANDIPTPMEAEVEVSVSENTPTDAATTEMEVISVDTSQGEHTAAEVETEVANPLKRSRDSENATDEAETVTGSPAKKTHRASSEPDVSAATTGSQQ